MINPFSDINLAADMLDELEKAEEENKRLREALAPFVKVKNYNTSALSHRGADSGYRMLNVKVEDIDRAIAVLKASGSW